jgi:hypothetical protein
MDVTVVPCALLPALKPMEYTPGAKTATAATPPDGETTVEERSDAVTVSSQGACLAVACPPTVLTPTPTAAPINLSCPAHNMVRALPPVLVAAGNDPDAYRSAATAAYSNVPMPIVLKGGLKQKSALGQPGVQKAKKAKLNPLTPKAPAAAAAGGEVAAKKKTSATPRAPKVPKAAQTTVSPIVRKQAAEGDTAPAEADDPTAERPATVGGAYTPPLS